MYHQEVFDKLSKVLEEETGITMNEVSSSTKREDVVIARIAVAKVLTAKHFTITQVSKFINKTGICVRKLLNYKTYHKLDTYLVDNYFKDIMNKMGFIYK